MQTSSNSPIDINKIQYLVDKIKDVTNNNCTLFFARELDEYEKALIEKQGFKYVIMQIPEIEKYNFDKNSDYVLPNIERSIKLIYQGDDCIDFRDFTVRNDCRYEEWR